MGKNPLLKDSKKKSEAIRGKVFGFIFVQVYEEKNS